MDSTEALDKELIKLKELQKLIKNQMRKLEEMQRLHRELTGKSYRPFL